MPDRSQTPAWEFAATGTRWRLYHSGGLSQAAVARIAAAVRRDEARWSRFDPDSELSGLNRRAGGWCQVTTETLALLDVAALWARRTGGIFQPLVGEVLSALGYRDSLSVRPPGAPKTPAPYTISAAIAIDRQRGRIRFPEGTSIDLGGIAKGWMATRAGALAATLSADPSLLIDAGGDLLAVSGEHLVAVESSLASDHPRIDAWVELAAGCAIATSGFRRRCWTNGDRYSAHHLIDPQSGGPGPFTHATVLARDAVTADVLAKVLALRPQRAVSCGYPARACTPEGVLTSRRWSQVAVAVGVPVQVV